MATVIWGEGQIGCPCGNIYQSGFVQTPTIRLGYRQHIKPFQPCPECQATEYLTPMTPGPMVDATPRPQTSSKGEEIA